MRVNSVLFEIYDKNRGCLKYRINVGKTDFILIFIRLQSRLDSLRIEPYLSSSVTIEMCLKERHKLVSSLVQWSNGALFKHIKLNLFKTSSNIKLSLFKTSSNIFVFSYIIRLIFKYIN